MPVWGALRAKLDALDASAAGAAGQRLKQVTILFLDMVGSTSLSQHLHPEEIHAVMDGALSRCGALVKSHGGRVVQYAEANLLATFGAEGAREDDAERAVREYAFKHQLLHQVTYETVLKRAQREMHARAAAWFFSLTDARAADFLAVAAGHYAEAGLEAQACVFYTRAAEHARARHANEATLDCIALALARVDGVGDEAQRLRLRWRLLDARERSFEVQGRRDEQLADLDAMEALAPTVARCTANTLHEEAGLLAEVTLRRSHRAMRMGDYAAQAVAARQALALAASAGDVACRLKAQRLLSSAIGDQGDIETARALALAGLDEAHARGLRIIEADFVNALAVYADRIGDDVVARAYGAQALAIVQDLGDHRRELMGRLNQAGSLYGLADFDGARGAARVSLRLARGLGDRLMECHALIVLSKVAVALGEYAQALTLAAAALPLAEQTQAQDRQIAARISQGQAELALGRHASATASFERALAMALDNGRFEPDARAGLACSALAQGDPAAAMRWLQPVLDSVASGEMPKGAEQRHLIRLTCWKASNAANDPRARQLLETAHDELQVNAGAITDVAVRQRYLSRNPDHRAIVLAWSARQGAAA